MRFAFVIVSLVVLSVCTAVHGGCSGSPPTYNGLPCATTTRYWDGQLGACGCGSNNVAYTWQQMHTAAASQAVFDVGGATWCGAGCGGCYELIPTGDCPTGSPCATQTAAITIMVTNLCPYNGNQEWCPNPGNANQFGYFQHFDLQDPNMSGWVDAIGWNNPVVTYRKVPCGGEGSPTCAEAATCECATTTCSASSAATTAATTTTTTTHATTAATTTTTTHATTAATTATTTHATSTTAAATTATTSSTGSSSGCHATLTSTDDAYTGGGTVTLLLKNTGSEPLKSATLTLSGSPSVWGVALVSGTTYSFDSYAFPLAVGSTFSQGGFTYTGTEPTITLGTVGC